MTKLLDRASHILNRLTEACLVLLVVAMVAVTFLQVIFRYGLDDSLSWSEELSRYLFIWVIFLGSAAAVRRREHLAVEWLVHSSPPAVRGWLHLVILTVTMAFFVVVVQTGLTLVRNAASQTSTALEISVSYVYAAAPVGGCLALVHLAAAFARAVADVAAGNRASPDTDLARHAGALD